ncbi:DUF6545 domain-containing protein [Amycolatopsis acidicola]|uniref:DUF6545 domain-containing protein n=1 Tax=Amycolatopsis acidicola TaxID=2596893 RepID=UPI003C7B2127
MAQLPVEAVLELLGLVAISWSIVLALARWVRSVHRRRQAVDIARLAGVLRTSDVTSPPSSDDEPALYRQMVEICDVFLTVRPYIRSSVRAFAVATSRRHRVLPWRRERIAAAAEMRVALDDYCRGRRPVAVEEIAPEPERQEIVVDEVREIAWLAGVSRAWHAPVTDEIVRLADEEA